MPHSCSEAAFTAFFFAADSEILAKEKYRQNGSKESSMTATRLENRKKKNWFQSTKRFFLAVCATRHFEMAWPPEEAVTSCVFRISHHLDKEREEE